MRTVLCVDVDLSLEDLSTKIRKAGYRCLTASSGDEAERLFVANTVDLVILHNGDPGCSGEGLAAHLKKIRDTKVLMLTQNLEPGSASRSVDFLLLEPSAPGALLNAVASLVGVVDLKAQSAGDKR